MCNRFFLKAVLSTVCVLTVFLTGVNIANAATATVELLTSSASSSWTQSNAPYNTYYMDSRAQSIYLKSDLEAAGMSGPTEITEACLQASQTPGSDIANLRVRMQNSTSTSLSAFTTTGWTTVYGPTSYTKPTAGDWVCHTLSPTFTWDGTNNLMVDVYRNDSSYTNLGGNYVRTTGAGRTYAGYCDNCVGCGVGGNCDLPSSRTSFSHALGVKLTYTFTDLSAPDVPTLNSPSDGATGVLAAPNLKFNYFDINSNSCVKFDIRVDNNSDFSSPEVNVIDYSTGGPWASGSAITYSVGPAILAGETKYYWKVRVNDGVSGWSDWSDGSWDFTTEGSTNDTDIVYGPEYPFNSGRIDHISLTAASGTNVFAAYHDTSSDRGIATIVKGGYPLIFSPSGAGNKYNFTDEAISWTSAVALDSSHVLITYADHNNIGKAIIATISDTTIISYGSEFTFSSNETSYISATTLDSTRVLISYRDDDAGNKGKAIIATITGSNISFGLTSVFNSGATSDVSATTLDSGRVLISFRDDGDSNKGKAVIATVAGNSISLGGEVTFETGQANYISATTLDPTHALIAYQNEGDSYGKALVASTSNSNIEFGPEHIFNPEATSFVSASAVDSAHALIAYRDGGSSNLGNAIMAEISGFDISFGQEDTFSYNEIDSDSQNTLSVIVLDQNKAFIGYSVYESPINQYSRIVMYNLNISTPEEIFHSGNLGGTGPSSATLSSTTVFIAYEDNATNKGTAVIATISEGNISYGPEYVFEPSVSGVEFISVTPLDANRVLIVYSWGYLHAVVATVSGNTITFGGNYTFSPGGPGDAFYISIDTLDSTHVLIAYADTNNGSRGGAVVATISGNTVSYGLEYIFNADSTGGLNYALSATALDPTHALIAYRDRGNSDYGTAIIATISAGNTISYGSEYVFKTDNAFSVSVAALDPNNVLISYFYTGTKGAVVVATVTGDTISYGSEYVYETWADNYGHSVAKLDATHAVITYTDSNAIGYHTVATVSGSDITLGKEYVFHDPVGYVRDLSATALDSDSFFIAYSDWGDNNGEAVLIDNVRRVGTRSWYSVHSTDGSGIATALDPTHTLIAFNGEWGGKAVVGTVSGSAINYGQEKIFNFDYTNWISVAKLDSTHALITYSDYSNGEYGTAVIATITGDSISYSSEYIFNSATTSDISITPLDSTRALITYSFGHGDESQKGSSRIATITGNTISFGPEYVFNTRHTEGNSATTLDPGHVLIGYDDYYIYEHTTTSWKEGNYTEAIVAAISGNTISYGTAFSLGYGKAKSTAALDPTHALITYSSTAVIATISGTDITLGSVYSLSGSAFATKLNSTHALLVYGNTGLIAVFSGTSTLAFGPEYVFGSGAVSATALDANHALIAVKASFTADAYYGGAAIIITIGGGPAPDTLYVGYPSAQTGLVNPTGFAYSTPFFSAVNMYGEAITDVQIQLTTSNDVSYSNPVWSSGDIPIDALGDGSQATIADGARLPDIFYGMGNAPSGLLEVGRNYIWRIRTKELEYSNWSSNGTIGMANGALTARFFTGAGDGYVYKGATGWNTAHDATIGEGTDYWSIPITQIPIASVKIGVVPNIFRAFLPFDTSKLPDEAAISLAEFKGSVEYSEALEGDANDFLVVVEGLQNSTATLVVEDYDQCGDSIGYAPGGPYSSEGSNRINISAITPKVYNVWTLNATGTSWISKTGWTKLGVREGHDLMDDPIASDGNEVDFSSSEQLGLVADPYLEITYLSPNTPTLISGDDNTLSVVSGQNVTFTGEWSDSDVGEQVRLLISKNANLTNCDYNTQTGCLAYSAPTTATPATAVYVAQTTDGDIRWYARVCDDDNLCSNIKTGIFTVGPVCQNHNVFDWSWSGRSYWNTFSCEDTSSSGDYGVDILDTTGEFSGFSWSEIIGRTTYDHAQDGIPSENGLIGGWSFNEGSGSNINDASENENDGTIIGATWGAGKYNSGLNFNESGYVKVPRSSSLDNVYDQVALEAWIKPTTPSDTSDWHTIVGKQNNSGECGGFNLLADTDEDTIYFHVQNRWLSAGITYCKHVEVHYTLPEMDKWYHIVGMYDKDFPSIKLYVNGELKDDTPGFSDPNAFGKPIGSTLKDLTIGGDAENNGAAPLEFKGSIDEVRVYNRTLSEEEVEAHYESRAVLSTTTGAVSGWARACEKRDNTGNYLCGEASAVEPVMDTNGLVAGYYMDENGGGFIYDESSNSNIGVLNGELWWTGGRYNSGIYFDGVWNSYVSIPNTPSLNPTNAISMEAWVKSDTVGAAVDYRTVIGKEIQSGVDEGGYGILTNEDQSEIAFYFTKDTGASFIIPGASLTFYSILPEKWYHIVGTYDKNTNVLAFYVNGFLVATDNADGSAIGTTTKPLYIGGDPENNSAAPYEFKGNIDGVRIYDRALTASEVKTHYTGSMADHSGVWNGWIDLKGVTTGFGNYGMTLSTSTIPYHFGNWAWEGEGEPVGNKETEFGNWMLFDCASCAADATCGGSYPACSDLTHPNYKVKTRLLFGDDVDFLPNAPTITGSTTGVINTDYEFGFVATDMVLDNTITLVDTAGDVGWHTSIIIGADGLPVISYRDETNGDLKVVKCGNAACSAGNTITLVDSINPAVSTGYHSSIAISTDGLPVISYRDLSFDSLKVVKCGNAACSAGNTITLVDTATLASFYTSIAIGADGFPVISYRDQANLDLKVVKCSNASCSAGNTITAVDTAGDVGSFTSIAVGADGLPVISYRDNANTDLKVAKCGNAACSAGNTITLVDTTGSVGQSTSIAIGADGLPVISYTDGSSGDLKVAKCGNAVCSAGNTITSVDTVDNVGWYTSIAIGTDGLPVISYNDQTNYDLKVVKCGNAACSAGNTINSVDTAGDVGRYTSIAIGADGLPVISYYDQGNFDLKVAKCGNASCSPEADQIRYGVDWGDDWDVMDGVVDEWLPSFGYVLSGITQSSTTKWSTEGAKTFQALAEDDDGFRSGWTEHTITISSGNPPTATIEDPDTGDSPEGVNINFLGRGQDLDGTIVVAEWRDYGATSDVGSCDAGTLLPSTLEEALPFFNSSFSTSTLVLGDHNICFRVKDDDGAWSEVTAANVILVTIVSSTQCSDGIDNDGDGYIDDVAGNEDPACYDASLVYHPEYNDESADPQCSDRINNDKDSLIDANDPGCWTDPTNSSTYDKFDNDENNCDGLACDPGETYPICPGDCPFVWVEF